MPGPNWAEQVTAVATAVGAVGLLAALGAALFAGQQVKEARKSRESQIAADFFRRWNEESLIETWRLVGGFKTKEELSTAFQGFIESNADEAYVLYRELDYFEQLAALEHVGAFDFELIKLLLGRTLINRWEMWRPSIDAMSGTGGYPMFETLVEKMKRALGGGHESQADRFDMVDPKAELAQELQTPHWCCRRWAVPVRSSWASSVIVSSTR